MGQKRGVEQVGASSLSKHAKVGYSLSNVSLERYNSSKVDANLSNAISMKTYW